MEPPFIIHTDGGARGNPGPAAYAFVIERPGAPIVTENGHLGQTTNNIAEYTALVKALEKAHELGGRRLHILSDSELMVRQMTGAYKVKNEGLLPLYREATRLCRDFDEVRFQHVRREQNQEADRLCNEALDAGESTTSTFPASPASPGALAPGVPAPVDILKREGIACLEAARALWVDNGGAFPPADKVWEQLCDILREHDTPSNASAKRR